ncbi:uncharacterized protein K452DRAFT_275544 [Aplosporella prunicola CBS 121167]|uniref:Glycoside hydrolase family 65 protein n=1 Tax=Aplosporella prunicola CBS 121167 TaxID=1176127 RepID=A0A6A6BA17_9PEZI|nr:uncharacterized protein K452DRAFT_275544 [Aplosporella prunicola CBS 121167]KAF2139341.1 hypothetical protein K452DRAFT_275544 [Aplosporella prunicola CBS 121167]
MARLRGWPSLAISLLLTLSHATIDRKSIVRRFNPRRNSTRHDTPMQLGNGNFAFGADITGLQSVLPWNILSSWCWHNSSLPTTPGQTSPQDFTGQDWWTHGRLVNYNQPNPAEADISQWLISNPHRVNLARVGLVLDGQIIQESDVKTPSQELDLYSGTLRSVFCLRGNKVAVETVADPALDAVGVQVQSELLRNGTLSVFFDYPYATDDNKFETYVGLWNATSNHTSTLNAGDGHAVIEHAMDATTYYTGVTWKGKASASGPASKSHRYSLRPQGNETFSFAVAFSPEEDPPRTSHDAIKTASTEYWHSYWEAGAFIDLTSVPGPEAAELQRRTILSQYLLAVNGAGKDPPQESGLANNGWYGKFHLEMIFWHLAHWGVWNKWDLFDRSMDVYKRFLPSSLERAAAQGYSGARWGKMSDPSGRSAPGGINSLLIWQQPHPLYFAELEYRAFPTNSTLTKWNDVVTATADFMSTYAFHNATTGVYDLGPPLYPVSENTNPNATINPTFELTYWRLGLSIAAQWQQRQGKPVPEPWTQVGVNLAPLPIENDTYVLYEGVPDMWTDPELTSDHPALVGIAGWLPPPADLNATVFAQTLRRVIETWDFDASYGWDFPLLALTAARTGDSAGAVSWLLHERFGFDDVGMPLGGSRVATPYFPASGGLLLAVGMLAGGWEGEKGPKWPVGWEEARAEGFGSVL